MHVAVVVVVASSINGRRVRGIDPPPHFRTVQFYKHVVIVSLTRSPRIATYYISIYHLLRAHAATTRVRNKSAIVGLHHNNGTPVFWSVSVSIDIASGIGALT